MKIAYTSPSNEALLHDQQQFLAIPRRQADDNRHRHAKYKLKKRYRNEPRAQLLSRAKWQCDRSIVNVKRSFAPFKHCDDTEPDGSLPL